jgi:hypothetical protein
MDVQLIADVEVYCTIIAVVILVSSAFECWGMTALGTIHCFPVESGHSWSVSSQHPCLICTYCEIWV